MQQINEIKRMQQLAGVISESQLNEGIIDLSDAQVDLLMDKTKFATKPGNEPGVFTVYDLSRPKGAASFGDDMASQKVGVLYTPESKYKAHKFESDDENAVKKLMAIKEIAPIKPTVAPKQTADVASLTKLIQSNTSLMNKLKTVNSGQEVTETIAFILNSINPKATGVNKTKLKSIIDQRFK